MADELGPKLSSKTADITAAIVVSLLAIAVLGVYFREALDLYQSLLDWFYSRNWQRFTDTAKIIFIGLDAVLLGFVVFTMRRYTALVRKPPAPLKAEQAAAPKDEIKNRWEHIRALANSSNPSDWNMAVLHADALLDDTLQHLEYEGTTLAERLKTIETTNPSKLPSLERIWSSHRLRNMIAHDPMEKHTKETIVHALRSYEQALKELGMMVEEKIET